MVASPLKVDPSRTATLRRVFSAEIQRRFNAFSRAVVKVVETPYLLDQVSLATNAPYAFQLHQSQLEAFKAFIKAQVIQSIIDESNDRWLQEYIQQAYEKGLGRAFDDVKYPKLNEPLDFYEGTRKDFLKSSFGQAVNVNRVKLLAARAFNDLKNITEAMSNDISRILVDGMIRGESPRDVARLIAKSVDGITKKRALLIAQTETLRAHNEGALDGLERLGVTEIGVMVEWSTAKDSKVCPLCAALQGIVLRVSEARGMFPRHPHCRCVPIPANIGEGTKGQKRSQQAIESAIEESVSKQFKKGSLEEKLAKVKWAGAFKKISQIRPRGVLDVGVKANPTPKQRDMLEKAKQKSKVKSPPRTKSGGFTDQHGIGVNGKPVYDTLQGLKDDPVYKTDVTATGGKVDQVGKDMAFYFTTSSGYRNMNAATLNGVNTPDHEELDKLIDTVPGYLGMCARGQGAMPPEHWEQWKSGRWAKVDWKCHSSTSIKPDSEFGSQGGVCYLIKSKGIQGGYIMPYSNVKDEEEILFKRGSQFRVVGWAETRQGLGRNGHRKLLLIEEVDGEIPLSQEPPPQLDAQQLWADYEKQYQERKRGVK